MYLTNRHEIAYAMNSTQFPVMRINLESPYTDGHLYFDKGSKCRLAYNGLNREGKLVYNMEDGKGFEIKGGCIGLTASFGYSDVQKMYEMANTPILHTEQIVVVVVDFPTERSCKVVVLKVGKRVNPHCTTMAVLEDLTAEEKKEFKAGFKKWFKW